ncbi:MAG: rhombosortase [Deltaproteobacteria bacterium]|nr:rhombosortase [Deltaproteobacteria bacterium]
MRVRCDFPWTIAIALLALLATAAAFASPAVADLLVADARIARGELWRAISGPFVHATTGHLVRDLALVALAGIAYEAPLGRRFLPIVVVGLVLPAIAVLAAGEASWYCGLSGLSHALLAAALAFEVTQRRGRVRLAVVALALVIATKPLYELVTGAPALPMDLGAGLRQVPLAHLVGVVVGIAGGLAPARSATLRFPQVYLSRAPMPTARGGMCCGVIDGALFAAGGEGTHTDVASLSRSSAMHSAYVPTFHAPSG